MNKIEHIGIAVHSLNEAIPRFERILGTSCYKTELVESEKVNTAFFKIGESKIELLESLDPDGVIAKFIAKRGEGLHHTAYEVDDIEQEMERLKKEGLTLLNEKPQKGGGQQIGLLFTPQRCPRCTH